MSLADLPLPASCPWADQYGTALGALLESLSIRFQKEKTYFQVRVDLRETGGGLVFSQSVSLGMDLLGLLPCFLKNKT